MDKLEITIKRVLEQGSILEERAIYLDKYISKILNATESDMLIERSKKYFPIGGDISKGNCKAEWIEPDVIEFTSKGFFHQCVHYRKIGDKYQKICYSRSNVNDRGRTIRETYLDKPMMDEEEMLNDMQEWLAE